MQFSWGHAKEKGQKAQEGGDFSPMLSYRWARERETSPGEDKTNIISALRLLAMLSRALRLLENSRGCYLFLCTSPGQPGSLRRAPTPLAPLLPPGSSAAAPCASAGLRGRLTPGKQEELAVCELSDWDLWLCPLWKGGALSCPRAEEKQISPQPLWSLAFGAAESKSARLKKRRVGQRSAEPVSHQAVPSKCC